MDSGSSRSSVHVLLSGLMARVAAVPPNIAYSIRFGVAVSAALWIAHMPGLVENESKWILITVLMVSQPTSGGSLTKGLLRAIGTLAGAIVAIVLFGLYSQNPPLLLASTFCVQAVGAYGYSGTRHQYAWFVFAFTTAIVLGAAITGGGQVETLAFQRASMVGLGLLIVFVMDALFWPTRSESRLRSSLATRARQLGSTLSMTIAPTTQAVAPTGHQAPPVSGALAAQLGLADATRTEVGVPASRVEALTRVAILLEALASRARILSDPVGDGALSLSEPPEVAESYGQLARQVGAALGEAAAALEGDREPDPFGAALRRVWQDIDALPPPTRTQGHHHLAREGRLADLRDLADLLCSLEETLGLLAAATEDAKSAERISSTTARQIDPFRVQVAFRAGIAVCAALLAVPVLGWQLDTIVVPISFMFASAPTRGGVVQAAMSILTVVAIGWALADLAIVFIYPHVGRMPAALAFAFAVASMLAYLSTARPFLASLPSIGGLIGILPVFSSVAAPTDVYGPYSTVTYLTLALGIGTGATFLLWPATATALFRQRMATLLDGCIEALTPSASDSTRSRQVGALLEAYAKQVVLLGALHGQARHEPVEHALDESRRAELLACSQNLFDAVLGAPGRARGEATAVWDRGGDLVMRLRAALTRADSAILASMNAVASALRNEGTGDRPSLEDARASIDASLAELRARAAGEVTISEDERRAVLVELDSRRQVMSCQLAFEAWLVDWQAAARGT